MDSQTIDIVDKRIAQLEIEHQRLIAQANSHAGAIGALRDVRKLLADQITADHPPAPNGVAPPAPAVGAPS